MTDRLNDPTAVPRLRGLALGTRVIVRFRIPSGHTDALGELIAMDDHTCTVRTRRRGDVNIAFGDIALAKPVPPPPPRRDRGTPHRDGGTSAP